MKQISKATMCNTRPFTGNLIVALTVLKQSVQYNGIINIIERIFLSSEISFNISVNQCSTTTDLNEIMSRTFGALGIFINKEFAKKVIRRRASKFVGTFMADSLTVNSK